MVAAAFSIHPERHATEVAEAIRFVDSDTVSVRGRFHRCSEVAIPRSRPGVPEPAMPTLVAATAQIVYEELYMRRRLPPVLSVADPAFVAALSQANTGTGTWEPGWCLRAKLGEQLVVERNGLHVFAETHEVRMDTAPTVGAPCRLRAAKEHFAALPGYYFIIGDAPPSPENRSQVRVYANLTAGGARPFIAALTSRLNAKPIPFRAKLLVDPRAYVRADAAVIYVDRRYYIACVAELAALARELADHVLDEAPLFARRVAPGFAIAEDPGTGESFGLHRSRAVAKALVRTKRRRAAVVSAAIAAEFEKAEIEASRPYLCRGSEDLYDVW